MSNHWMQFAKSYFSSANHFFFLQFTKGSYSLFICLKTFLYTVFWMSSRHSSFKTFWISWKVEQKKAEENLCIFKGIPKLKLFQFLFFNELSVFWSNFCYVLKFFLKMFGIINKWFLKAKQLNRWGRLGAPPKIKWNQNKDGL